MELIIFILLVSTVCLVLSTYRIIKKKDLIGRKEKDAFKKADADLEGDEVLIVGVQFEGYSGRYEYEVNNLQIHSGDYVLVLTHDGIRCAKVVTNPRAVNVKDLKYPPFLLQSIICTAEASDVAYYNDCTKNMKAMN